MVDKIGMLGQYILTGFSVPIEDDTLHIGEGRFFIIDMKPMTLYESGNSNGKNSLTDLFNHKLEIDGKKSLLDY